MKTLKLMIIGLLFCLANIIHAQIAINVTLNPPLWGPAGYSEVRYYYLPDVEAYYDIQSLMFIYYRGGKWTRGHHLPAHNKNYDLYNGYKVVMSDYHGNTPYIYFKDHKLKYAKGYQAKKQKTVGKKPGKGNYMPNTYFKSRTKKNTNPAQGNHKNTTRSNSYENKRLNDNNTHKGAAKNSGNARGKK